MEELGTHSTYRKSGSGNSPPTVLMRPVSIPIPADDRHLNKIELQDQVSESGLPSEITAGHHRAWAVNSGLI